MWTNIADAHDEEDAAGTGSVTVTVVLPTAVTVLLVAALGVWLLVHGAGESRRPFHVAAVLRTSMPARAIAADPGRDGAAVPMPAHPQPRPAPRPPYVVYLVDRPEQRAALGVPEGSPDALVVVVSSQETLAATLGLVQMLAMGASEEPVAREVRVVDLRH